MRDKWGHRSAGGRATEVARGPMHQTAAIASTYALPAPPLRFPETLDFLRPLSLSFPVSRSVFAFVVNLGELAYFYDERKQWHLFID